MQRLDRLFPALTAKERALLVLKAWKENGEEEGLVRSTMPASQVAEFNRLITLMNGANHHLGIYLLVLRAQVQQLGLRFGWLASLHQCATQAWSLGAYIFEFTREPITRSEHTALVAEARARMAPVGEFAELLVQRHEGWAETDLMPPPNGGDGEPWVTDEAWNRLLAQKQRELTALVEQGTLAGKRSGKQVLINTGSFYDWLGEPVPASAEWGLEFDVLPDERGPEVERLRQERRYAREALRDCPTPPKIADICEQLAGPAPEKQSWADQVTHLLLQSLREGLPELWRELRAAEQAVEETAVEFDGEDPAVPPVRQSLDKVRSELLDLRESMRMVSEDVELPEPDEEAVAGIRRIVQRDLPDLRSKVYHVNVD